MRQLVHVGMICLILVGHWEAQEGGKVEGKIEAMNAQILPHFNMLSAEYGGIENVDVVVGTDARIVYISPQEPDATAHEITLSFHPLAVTGDARDRIFVSGASSKGVATIQAIVVRPKTEEYRISATIFEGEKMRCPTGVQYVRINDTECLFVLDSFEEKLWCVFLNSGELRLLATRESVPEIRGMRYFKGGIHDGQLLFELSDARSLHDYGDHTAVTWMVDRDLDMVFDDVSQAFWSEAEEDEEKKR